MEGAVIGKPVPSLSPPDSFQSSADVVSLWVFKDRLRMPISQSGCPGPCPKRDPLLGSMSVERPVEVFVSIFFGVLLRFFFWGGGRFCGHLEFSGYPNDLDWWFGGSGGFSIFPLQAPDPNHQLI